VKDVDHEAACGRSRRSNLEREKDKIISECAGLRRYPNGWAIRDMDRLRRKLGDLVTARGVAPQYARAGSTAF